MLVYLIEIFPKALLLDEGLSEREIHIDAFLGNLLARWLTRQIELLLISVDPVSDLRPVVSSGDSNRLLKSAIIVGIEYCAA